MLSYSRPIERCHPLLGTFVRIRVRGLEPERANAAIGAAFAEIAQVHRLMSFHEAQSDVSRLNREAHIRPVPVDARTFEVLTRAMDISSHSDGVFDVTVAPELVARGSLPPPQKAPDPDPTAIWRDIELLEDSHVRFTRPLWVDLGGIAKGYAVDRATALLQTFSPVQASVNAGGDLRVVGADSEHVRLAPDHCVIDMAAFIDIENGSMASSCGGMAGRRTGGRTDSPYVETHHGRRMQPPQFVSVAAPRCVDADALTKVVMALGACSSSILAAFSAQAVVHDAQFGWRTIQGVA